MTPHLADRFGAVAFVLALAWRRVEEEPDPYREPWFA